MLSKKAEREREREADCDMWCGSWFYRFLFDKRCDKADCRKRRESACASAPFATKNVAAKKKHKVGESMGALDRSLATDSDSGKEIQCGGADASVIDAKNLPDGYICLMHRGAVVDADAALWARAARVHLRTPRTKVADIQCGENSCMKVVQFDNVPHTDRYLEEHAQYVVKKCNRATETRLHECRTLRALADCAERNSHYFALPLEMWCNESPDEYVIMTPKRQCDLFDFMLACAGANGKKRLAYKTVGRIASNIARALRILHDEYNVAHNDLKPENVLIDPRTMHCWLCDFGGAVMLETGQVDHFIQTLLYASPERHQRRKCDTRTDIWSLGLIAAELRCARTLGDHLVPEERWLFLLRQPQTFNLNENDALHADEWLNEPGVLSTLCDESDALSPAFRAFLQRTVRHYKRDRSSAAQLLQANDCSAFLQIKSNACGKHASL